MAHLSGAPDYVREDMRKIDKRLRAASIETKPDINLDWKANAQANAAALNTLYEYVGTSIGPIPAIEHMKDGGMDPVVLVGHIIEVLEMVNCGVDEIVAAAEAKWHSL